MKILQCLMICFLISTTFPSCQGNNPPDNSHGKNSIYYWRTNFSLSDGEREFLRAHDVDKIYMRFFDVDFAYYDNGREVVTPQATIKFIDTVPDGIGVVPTVYITTSAMEEMQAKEEEYAEKIFRRITAMCKQNNIDCREIQLDCDWTKKTQKAFFRLCECIKSCMDSTQALSSTIRLHQLTQTPPPADKGVLMVYNTGNLMQMTTANSIFSMKDIEPYLRDNRLADYPLPMDIAYPAYGWSIVFSKCYGKEKYRFDRIMHRTDFSSFPHLKSVGNNIYEVTSDFDFAPGTLTSDRVFKGDRIRLERPAASDILEVKSLIERQLTGKPHNTLLYHLDEIQLSNYSDNEISEIYSCN